MSTLYGSKKEKGRLLASGKGVNSMMDVAYKKHYTEDNSILSVTDTNDFNSSWKIYERRKPEQLRNDMTKSYERLYNSPAMQLLRDKDKGIHPTSYDKNMTGTKIIKVRGHYKVVDR